jgi:hypothetical protein
MKRGNWETEHYNSVLEITGPRSFISGNTYIGTRYLYWILTGPSFAVRLSDCVIQKARDGQEQSPVTPSRNGRELTALLPGPARTPGPFQPKMLGRWRKN